MSNLSLLALATAEGAVTTSKSASSKISWESVAAQWQMAIDLLKSIPTTNKYYPLAKKKLPEYQRNLTLAKKKATITPEVNEVNQIQTVVAEAEAEVEKEAERAKQEAEKDSAKTFLQDYLDYITTKGGTGSGTGYFCQDKSNFASSLYAPTSAEVLDMNVYSDGEGASATVRIDSSNKGGSPIRADWSFYIKKGPALIGETTGGWCLELISEQ